MTDDDSTPRIAIIGAGPIGLEAALYGRYLGFAVALFEKGYVANNVQRWGHVRMFSPFGLNRSLLGLAALQAQQDDTLPADDAQLTGTDYVNRYLLPLANSDLLVDSIHENVEVLRVGRDGVMKSDSGDFDRSEHTFRLLLRSERGEEYADADYVLDTSGVFDQPRSLGHGGVPAIGELDRQSELHFTVPDVLGADRPQFAGRRTLVVGGGYSAATSIVALGKLRQDSPATSVIWVTRRALTGEGPISRRPHDRLPLRDKLASEANELARASEGVVLYDQTGVVRVARHESENGFVVTLQGKSDREVHVDEIVAQVGYRPNLEVTRELQLDLSPETEGSRQLANWLREGGDVDCLDLEAMTPAMLKHPEPDFFVLGSKSFGSCSNFLLAKGIEQVRDVYTLIAEREDLDLYKTMEHLVD